MAAASCSKKSAPPQAVVPDRPATSATSLAVDASSSDASVDAGPYPLASVAAWTDPEMVDVLRHDCTFDPYKLTPEQSKALFGIQYVNSALLCNGGEFDQSCVYDPCFQGESWNCKADCLKSCRTCDQACIGDCVNCKAQCTDDVCREACAPTCATCRQKCLTEQDRCRTAKCTELYEACMTKLTHDWRANGCASACTSYIPCRDACYDKMTSSEDTATQGFDSSACIAKCKASAKAGCDVNLCGGKYGNGIEMN